MTGVQTCALPIWKEIITQETIRDDLKKIVETEKQIIAIESKMDEIKHKDSCCSLDVIKNKLNDQDFQQKIGFIPLVAVELYRVMVSSLLVLFVPQKCEDHVCSLNENLIWENHLYNAGLIVNFITLASFLSLYYCEVKRENRLITYLDVNKNVILLSIPSDLNVKSRRVSEKIAAAQNDYVMLNELPNTYDKIGRAHVWTPVT